MTLMCYQIPHQIKEDYRPAGVFLDPYRVNVPRQKKRDSCRSRALNSSGVRVKSWNSSNTVFVVTTGVEGADRDLNKHLQSQSRRPSFAGWGQIPCFVAAAGMTGSSEILASLGKKKIQSSMTGDGLTAVSACKGFSNIDPWWSAYRFFLTSLPDFPGWILRGNKIELQSVFFDTSLPPPVIHLELENNRL